MFVFSQPNRRRTPSLTPMIDVVFLLLVFFMLVAQFNKETALTLSGQGGVGEYTGPPRLVTVLPQTVLLNGQSIMEGDLPDALTNLTSDMGDTIVLRADDATDVQRLIDIVQFLSSAGFTGLVLVE